MFLALDNEQQEEVYFIKQYKLGNIEEKLFLELSEFFSKKRIAYFAYMSLIETLDSSCKPADNLHFCLIIKPSKKFQFSVHTKVLYNIISKYIPDTLEQFVDFCVLGYEKSIYFNYKKEDCIRIYSEY